MSAALCTHKHGEETHTLQKPIAVWNIAVWRPTQEGCSRNAISQQGHKAVVPGGDSGAAAISLNAGMLCTSACWRGAM